MVGAEPVPVSIEVSLTPGRPAFHIVGLPDAAVREARQRVQSAVREQGFRFPGGIVVVNLSPADLPKAGATYDLPIALAIVAASTGASVDFAKYVAVGELSLHGDVRPVRALMGAIEIARAEGMVCLASVGSAVREGDGALVKGVASLAEAVAVAAGTTDGRVIVQRMASGPAPIDIGIVRGQDTCKRAIEVSAAGGHHLLMTGPPGSGKTLLARCLPGILPRLTNDEEREVALVWAAAGLDRPVDCVPPFRSPHHSASLPALVGGGVGTPTPGEVSVAHRGVLFLDELGEFPPGSLDALRQPIEDGQISIARSNRTVRFPSRIQVVAATNPCPCGYDGDWRIPCECADANKQRYKSRLSGPFSDRIDIHIDVLRVPAEELSTPPGEPASAVRERVEAARSRQLIRSKLNRELTLDELDELPVTDAAASTLARVIDAEGLSGRGWDRLRRLSRTIADLAAEDVVDVAHLEEAIELRRAA